MNLNRKAASLAITLMAVVSCSSVGQNSDNNNSLNSSNANINKENKKDSKAKVTFVHTFDTQKDRFEKFEKENNKKGNQNFVEKVNADNFNFTGVDYLYKGEKLNGLGYITPEIKIESAYADNPVIEVSKNDSRYEKYNKSTENVKVEEIAEGKKKITFLNQNTVYLNLVDKNGNTKKVMLNKPIEVKEIPEVKDGIRYQELKKGADNGRVSYSVVTYNGGYEDIAKDWNETFDKSKYEDLDDLEGSKIVDVKTSVNGVTTYSVKDVDFGIKLSDFKENYEKIFSDLDRFTLKFSKDGNTVEGGFNPDIVEKLKRYEKSIDKNTKLEFVTEVLDANKNEIGIHNISRKIIKDGKVIFEKKEKAFIAFPGTTIGVADSSFYDLTPEVEARSYRYTNKSLNASEDDLDDPNGMFRPHGSFVMGAAIDESVIGQSHFLEKYVQGIRLKRLLNMGLSRNFNDKQLFTRKKSEEQLSKEQDAEYKKLLAEYDIDENKNITKVDEANDEDRKKIEELEKQLGNSSGNNQTPPADNNTSPADNNNPPVDNTTPSNPGEGNTGGSGRRRRRPNPKNTTTSSNLADDKTPEIPKKIDDEEIEKAKKEKEKDEYKLNDNETEEGKQDNPKDDANKPLTDEEKERILFNEIKTGIRIFNSTKFRQEYRIFNNRVQALYNKYNASKDRFENILKITDKSEREKELKALYQELYDMFEEAYITTEKQMLDYSDLHFSLVAIEDPLTGNLDRSITGKNLPLMLEENKNIKAVNMSYGNALRVEDYIDIKNMTDEQKERAADAYNNDVNFRVAVQTWLQSLENVDLGSYKSVLPGVGNIPSVLKYFKSRDKITKVDYQKLLDLKLLTIRHNLLSAPELSVANKDVLLVVAQGNTKNNLSNTEVNLTGFNKDGKKIVYEDLDHVYNNSFGSVTTYLNLLAKEEADKKGETYKYNTGYRKNILGVVGLMSGKLSFKPSDKFYEDKWKLVTVPGNRDINSPVVYVAGLKNKYDSLYAELKKVDETPEKYAKEYRDELLAQIQSIDNLLKIETDIDGRPLKASFTRAGKSKLSVVASEGHYVYAKSLTKEEREKMSENDRDSIEFAEKHGINFASAIGSSFAAPRVTAIAGEVGTRFPWMKAQQVKQVILTTADDDYNIIGNEPDIDLNKGYTFDLTGQLGPDENLGWGMANKYRAYGGPGRFVKALTRELGEENFVADVPYGFYEFKNNIKGKFEIGQYFESRKLLDANDGIIYDELSKYSKEFVLSKEFGKDDKSKKLKDVLESRNKTLDYMYNVVEPKIKALYNSLDDEEKELFEDAGITKKGQGTLMLSGENTYKAKSIVEEGTLVLGARNTSDFEVKEKGKLKLDVVYNQKRKDKEIQIDYEYVPELTGSITNEGEVYSYSKYDILKNKYKPVNKGKTYISAQAHFQIDELDLSSVDTFNFDIFRKKGMNIFDLNQYAEEVPDPDNKGKLVKKITLPKNPDEVTFLTVNKLNKKYLDKVQLGDIQLTPFIKMTIEKEELKDDKENVKLIGKLIRKDSESNPAPQASRIRAALKEELLNSDDVRSKILSAAIESLDWMEGNDKTLSGEILANSQLVGYDVANLKSNLIKERLATDIKIGKSAIYFDTITSNRFAFDKNKGDKNVLTNGFNLGTYYRSKNNTTGISLNYSNSALFDYVLPLLDVREPINPKLTAEEKQKELDRRKVKTLSGNVYANILGLNTYNKFELNNGYLTSILSLDIISKDTSRKVLDREVRNMQSTDVMTNLNLEGGYKFELPKNITLEPFVGLDMITYLRGQFNESAPSYRDANYKEVENTEFGYKSDQTEVNFKANMTIGSRVRFTLKNNWNIGGFASYTKYLTDPILKTKAELANYKFRDEVKGITLEDNVFNYGIDARYTLKDNIEFKLSYSGKNLKTHGLSTGIRFQF